MDENVTIVQVKGAGAGKDTMMEIPKRTWDQWQKDFASGNFKEAGNWKLVPKEWLKKGGEVVIEQPKEKTPEEVMAEVSESLNVNAQPNEVVNDNGDVNLGDETETNGKKKATKKA